MVTWKTQRKPWGLGVFSAQHAALPQVAPAALLILLYLMQLGFGSDHGDVPNGHWRSLRPGIEAACGRQQEATGCHGMPWDAMVELGSWMNKKADVSHEKW